MATLPYRIVLLLCEAEIETNNICHINNGDHNGNTPLHCACSNGHIQIVKYLIQNGSNLDDRLVDIKLTRSHTNH